MTTFPIVAEPSADVDVQATFARYQNERPGLGFEFLEELKATYDRVAQGPFKYQHLQGGIRRALVRRFPYSVYFAVEGEVVVVVAVLRASRDPAEWQQRRW